MKFALLWARRVRAIAAAALLAAALPSSLLHAKTPLLPATAAAISGDFAECPSFFANGTPPAVQPLPRLRALCYDAFAVLHNGSTKTPMFVAQRLNRALVEDADEKRSNRFYADARLPRAERAELEDYKRSGYSRGHMAPAGDMPTPQAMAQSFSLANMVPQSIEQNSGPWARIEQDTRRYARRAQGDVFIITGPVYQGEEHSVGANHVRVPSHLFKLVYDAQTHRAWAHWQANADHATVTRPISYQELVRRTGIEFLPGIQVR
ncbi:DNA/RNA non-specific endonuclease [Comamonas terrigena]|uniref:DNA/RNA non-specific endonuclease n=1 Tax=Comamonas terrigena TaxID=32013 RepID=UPI00244AD75C|nr:DNA/RNA non-specific endonuclease [Comamonas terrigena]MDH0049688.1 DNA/RNA non-specific endonuclease [Comamonas terrigena]MDH0511340.1 DNA/RNA non-specific endonuclease [Comamonas terrigena]MDH1091357.1 DNA/RNA non-specific endonuclease [Comamonas terrigena]MDH1501783.1 DNA/RNA non-specific endonuclease [Comamonas terrigena]